MGGWTLVGHAAGMVLRNPSGVVRATAVPWVASLAAFALLGPSPEELAMIGLGRWPDGILLGTLAAMVVSILSMAWSAVAWHRFVLLEEQPGLVPTFRPNLILPYAGRSLAILLVLIVMAVPIGMIAVLVGLAFRGTALAGALGLVVTLLAIVLLAAASLRLGLTLPARSVGRPITFGDAWTVTAPARGAILRAAALLTAVNVALNLPFGFIAEGGVPRTLAEVLVGWITTVLGLSLLTTLYGHLVEGRPLSPTPFNPGPASPM